MISSTTISYFFGFWAVTYLIDASLAKHPYTRQRYAEFRQKSGMSIEILQARFFTQKLNPFFQYIGKIPWFPWNIWFSIGTAFASIFMCLSVIVLSILAFNTVMKKPIEKQLLTPVMPGVNLPTSQLGFYLLTLLICVVLHEAGHALAALTEKVRLHGFGFFLFGIYPGAYVDINDTDLTNLSPLRQLKIYSAGVWHNGVIVILSIIVFYTLPWIMSPAYILNRGVGVIDVQQNSIFTGHRGLNLGDAITQVNACPVKNSSGWYRCLESARTTTSGYCISGTYAGMLDSSNHRVPGGRKLAAVVPVDRDSKVNPQKSLQTKTFDCCPSHLASTHLCFTYLSHVSLGKPNKLVKKPKYTCLPARTVTEREPCRVPSDCGPPNTDPNQRSICVIPSPPENQSRLVRIVHNRARSQAILFLGPIDDLLGSIRISDYVPRLPQIMPCKFPQIIATFCMYLFSLSGALVLLNVVPCYALDGQWILKSMLDLLLPSVICSRQIRRLLYSTVLTFGTLLLAINIGLALWYLILETTSLSSQNAYATSPKSQS